MAIAVYAGSFDPITNGHLDILKSAASIFDKVIIAVAKNPDKKSFLPLETRLKLIQKSIADIPNAEVDSFDGLTVEYAKSKGAKVLIRGLRNSADFEYEFQLAQINSELNNSVKTLFLTPKPQNNIISSSMIREILNNGGDISNFVPQIVNDTIRDI